MTKLFDENWQWLLDGNHDAIAVGKVIRPIVRVLEKKGYNRSEILNILVIECFEELLNIALEKKQDIFHPTHGGKDVHTEHCCIEHGCKYGNLDCVVWLGYKAQSYPCEHCQIDEDGSFSHEEQSIPVVLKSEIDQRRKDSIPLD